MDKYYIFEIQKLGAGSYAYLVHEVSDVDPTQALLKAESKYYQVLSAAAISQLPSHGAIMFAGDSTPMMNKRYTHYIEPEPEQDQTPEEEPEQEPA